MCNRSEALIVEALIVLEVQYMIPCGILLSIILGFSSDLESS